MSAPEPAATAAAVAALFSFAALTAAGGLSWSRTRRLRAGGLPTTGPGGAPGPPATSRATHLAAGCGWCVAALGALAPWSPQGRLLLVAWGAAAAAAGTIGRVTSLRAGPSGLDVGYRGRAAFRPSWSEVTALRAPRWPLGGWRVDTARGARTLMPSDLLGHEHLLATVVARGGLRFDGHRSWVRPHPPTAPG